MAQALTSLRSGMLDNTISMDFLIQFLQQKADATVISEPQITISDNDMGKLFVGQVDPDRNRQPEPQPSAEAHKASTTGMSGSSSKSNLTSTTPATCRLRVRAESSTLDPTQMTPQPVIDSAQFRTELTAKAGETLVLGGIIQKQLSDTIYKTPILGSIPVLKYVFSKRDKSVKRTELLVFLRPKVVRSPEQARELLEEVNREDAPDQKMGAERPGLEAATERKPNEVKGG